MSWCVPAAHITDSGAAKSRAPEVVRQNNLRGPEVVSASAPEWLRPMSGALHRDEEMVFPRRRGGSGRRLVTPRLVAVLVEVDDRADRLASLAAVVALRPAEGHDAARLHAQGQL